MNSKDFNPVVKLNSNTKPDGIYAYSSAIKQIDSTQKIELGNLTKVRENDIDSVLDN